jgi:hypothetical protein
MRPRRIEIVKTIGTLGGVVIASIVLLQPAQAGHRGGGRSFSSGFHGSGGARQFAAAPSRNFSSGGARFHSSGTRFNSGGARFHNSSARFSSGATFRNRSFSNSGPRFTSHRQSDFNTQGLNPRGNFRNGTRWDGQRFGDNRSSGRSRWDGQRFGDNRSSDRSRWDGQRSGRNRSSDFRNRDFNNNNGRIVGRRGGNWNRHWDKRRDHHWRGHRCRWVNNSWVIFATSFYPYGYGYYPYGGYYPYAGYSYYDDGDYADTDASDPYAKSSDYDEGAADSSVSQVQSALSREGYYSGAIDGNLGPETRNALRRYQRDRGLNVTGRVDRATINALGLR